jgi:hypothetical protein
MKRTRKASFGRIRFSTILDRVEKGHINTVQGKRKEKKTPIARKEENNTR